MYIKPNEFDLATAEGVVRLPRQHLALVRTVGLLYLLVAGTLALPTLLTAAIVFAPGALLRLLPRLTAAADKAGATLLGR
jgi:hypothetical protein